MTFLEWGGVVGLWLSRMEVSEGVGEVESGCDTSRTEFFILTDGQLLSSPITNENRSDQNCPITASAVGSEWAATAFWEGSSLSMDQNLGESSGKGEERLISYWSGQWLFLSTVWESTIMELGLIELLFMSENKSCGCRSHNGVFPEAFLFYLFKDWISEVVPWLRSLTSALLNVLGCLYLLQNLWLLGIPRIGKKSTPFATSFSLNEGTRIPCSHSMSRERDTEIKRHLLSYENCSQPTGYQRVERKCDKKLLDGEPCGWFANEVNSNQILKASC